jgi:DNA-binding NarL/FixJ family response regulator
VERLEELEPDAVLLDLAMPRLDGLEAIGRLRIADPDVAIVVLSGFGSTRLAPAARRLGADSYIEKGRPLAEIREEVLRAIASRATSAGRTRAQR